MIVKPGWAREGLLLVTEALGLAFRDDSPADIANAEMNPLGQQFMQRLRSACFRTMPVGLQPGLCKRCERKERAQCRH
eukprot:2323688-Rhodomonas_salina.1